LPAVFFPIPWASAIYMTLPSWYTFFMRRAVIEKSIRTRLPGSAPVAPPERVWQNGANRRKKNDRIAAQAA